MKRKDLDQLNEAALRIMFSQTDFSAKQICFAIVLSTRHMLKNKLASGKISFADGTVASFQNAKSTEHLTEFQPKIPRSKIIQILTALTPEFKEFSSNVEFDAEDCSVFIS